MFGDKTTKKIIKRKKEYDKVREENKNLKEMMKLTTSRETIEFKL